MEFAEFNAKLSEWRLNVKSPDDNLALPGLVDDLISSYVDEKRWLEQAVKVLTSWPFKLSNREIADVLNRAITRHTSEDQR